MYLSCDVEAQIHCLLIRICYNFIFMVNLYIWVLENTARVKGESLEFVKN